MKAIAFNGSPRTDGNTAVLLDAVAAELRAQGIEVETVQVGNKPIRGCLGCADCAKNKNERCAIDDDAVNGWIQKMKEADAILLGSPVHFSGIAATMKCFLDRAFYVSASNRGLFRHKVGASVVAVRRSGGVAAFDGLNHYLQYSEMLVPGSNYWNVGHGGAPGEAAEDTEAIQCMRILGRNMAWLVKLVEAGRGVVPEPEREPKRYMNFIR